MYKQDLALNNLQGLICHKTQPNQIIYICTYFLYIYMHMHAHIFSFAQSAGAVEYTDCFSAEG